MYKQKISHIMSPLGPHRILTNLGLSTTPHHASGPAVFSINQRDKEQVEEGACL